MIKWNLDHDAFKTFFYNSGKRVINMENKLSLFYRECRVGLTVLVHSSL